MRARPFLFITHVLILTTAILVAATSGLVSAQIPIGVEFLINTTTTGAQSQVDVDMDPFGAFVVVWRSDPTGGGGDILAQRFDASANKLGGEITVAATADDEVLPVVVLRPGGGFIVAWELNPATLNELWVRCYDATGTPVAAAQQIDPGPTSSERRPAIAMADDGAFVVAFEEGGEVYAQRFDNTCTTIGSAFQVNVYTTGAQNRPGVALDSNKDIIVAWTSNGQDGSGNGIYARRFTWAGSGGAEFLVNTFTLNSQYAPDIAIQSTDIYIITWTSELQDGSGQGVFAQRFSTGDAKLGSEFQVNTYWNSLQASSRVAVDGLDAFTIVWNSLAQDGDGMGIYEQRFKADGTPVGTEFLVNTTTVGAQQVPRVAIGGQEVVVWEGDGADPDSYGVQGQRYAAPLAAPSLEPSLVSPPEITNASLAFTCSVTVDNWGQGCSAFRTSLWLSADSVITMADVFLGSFVIDTLDAASDTTRAIVATLTSDVLPGDAYLGVIADDLDQVAEFDETDNTTWNLLAINVPAFESIEDVFGDQGGFVHLKWWACPLDAIAQGLAISEYTVWRAIDIHSAASLLESGAAVLFNPAVMEPSRTAATKTERVFRHEESASGTIFWELVGTQPAYAFPGYAMTVGTLFDSTSVNDDFHYFQVIAHLDTAPMPYYVSAMDSSRSIDDLPPGAPQNLAGVQTEAEGLDLTWDANGESDLWGYRVHRGTDPGFVPSSGNLIGTSVTPEFFDDGWRWDGGFYYKVCATDVHENVSDYSLLEPATITGVPDAPPKAVNALAQNTPNPFNPITSIRYSLEAATDARLAIYDTRGRLVRTLLNGPKTKGGHTTIWDGKDNGGQRVASGVYFYRLEAGTFTQTRKLVFLK